MVKMLRVLKARASLDWKVITAILLQKGLLLKGIVLSTLPSIQQVLTQHCYLVMFVYLRVALTIGLGLLSYLQKAALISETAFC